MQNVLFLQTKIARQISLNGQSFEFKRFKFDKYNVITDEVLKVYTLKGIFHEAVSYQKPQDAEAGRMVAKPQPMILTLIENDIDILKDDVVRIGNNTFTVVEKHDVKGLQVAYDISLEVVL